MRTLDEVETQTLSNTLVSDINPMTVFPMESEADLVKLEARVEGWYSLIDQLGALKAVPNFQISPFNRVGLLYVRIEQYLLAIANGCTEEEKKQYWGAVEAAKLEQNLEVFVVAVSLEQLEFAKPQFSGAIARAAEEPVYVIEDHYSTVLKRLEQYIRVRRWQCSGYRAKLSGSKAVIQQDELLGLEAAIAKKIDDQENEAILRDL